MADTTSRMTRALIQRALRAGMTAEEAVRDFYQDGRQAMTAFDRDVDRLQLDDGSYRKAVDDSGLWQVLAIAGRIGEAIEALQTGRAA